MHMPCQPVHIAMSTASSPLPSPLLFQGGKVDAGAADRSWARGAPA